MNIPEVILLLLLSIAVLFLIMTVVRNCSYPPPKNWIDVDMGIERKPMFRHFKDCGLLYPVLFVYIVYGLYQFFLWRGAVVDV